MTRTLGRFVIVTVGTFLLSITVSYISKALLASLPLIPSLVVLFLIILTGILFDAIGVAATAAQEEPFNAMAVDRVRGAKQAIAIIRNADKVGTFANDVVGDIAGTVSGAIAATIVFYLLVLNPDLNERMWTTITVSGAAALTVGGKALGKSFAINRANEIVHVVGTFIYWTERLTGIQVSNYKRKKRNRRNRNKNYRNRRREKG